MWEDEILKRSILWFTSGLLLFTAACSNGGTDSIDPDTFSSDDMCIVKVDNTSEKVCYGMNRSEVEALLGETEGSERQWLDYDAGVSIIYREDSIAAIRLNEPSVGTFQTGRGAAPGMEKEDIKAMYGQQHAIEELPGMLDYFYDMTDEMPLAKEDIETQRTADEMDATFLVSFAVDQEYEQVTTIMLLDRKMAIFFQ